MLYIRLEDNQLHLASYALPTEQQREAALALGRILPEEPMLSLTQRTLTHGASVQQALADMRLELPEFNEYVKHSPVTVIVSGPATLVPADSVNEADDAFIFNSCFSFSDHTERSVYANELPALRQRLLFGVMKTVEEAIGQEFRYPDLRYVSALTPVLEHFAGRHRDARGIQIYVNCRNRFVDLFVFSDKRLQVLNSFPVNSVADASYYVVALMKNMDYSIAGTPCCVLGDPVKVADLAKALRCFLPNVVAIDSLREFGAVNMATLAEVPFDLMAHIKK